MSVSFWLKSEPVAIIKKIEFLVKDKRNGKFLETFRVPNIAFAANGIRKKIWVTKLGDQIWPFQTKIPLENSSLCN